MSRILKDGFKIRVVFGMDANVEIEIKNATPPGWEGGEPVDTTTQSNNAYRTQNARQLMSMTAGTMEVAYDPVIYQNIQAMLNKNQLLSFYFPDGSYLNWYGWVRNFQPGQITEGTQPTATITLEPSNQDSNGNEAGPTYHAASPVTTTTTTPAPVTTTTAPPAP